MSLGKNGNRIGAAPGNQNGKGNLGKRYNTVGEPSCCDETLSTAMRRALDSVSMCGPYSPEAEAEADRICGITARLADVNDAIDPEPDCDLEALKALFADDLIEADQEPTRKELSAIEKVA